ncbi:F-box/kelch-repeat protein At3g23880-like [Vicia villosa]|uniref:F-box/kelch-repeat protein At3g23880-like n=1 Tax=Vicia villosa TaxID=3911 RepID=UPI00273BD1F3|nr:F-box/kelch-repeat protein At3g23880-like [Vicia villosa]XP_058736936.1 F-box/kelch-repeat protein At3g23880-like [Vicia villosa]XP_058736937.1 F-box/kelch-repeat protein At3g23880-like [Vicia villosa]XP_058736938.1 F-box/kelch-repeat protein At3g23880-like [Vicia villosa]XP_058736939.1 F-box/kelch-repeat protein At3g23880-like [Vicia villosa]XP_058736940.1 F-box/kelch-repeat protein At3g23880-like [Vicia villosa]XP_058736941.1 F-box/kelch-repeat protein At3g23880-like [Vicia villosa]XP_0
MSDPPAKSRALPDAELPVSLPDELITEVLSFADAKTLMQMKCVSKFWNSIVADPKFVKLHFKRSAQNPHLALFLSKSHLDGDNSVVPFSVSRLVENPLITLPNNPCYGLRDKECRFVIGSCNGWLCLLGYSCLSEYRQIWFRFWNPATGKISQKLGYFWDHMLGLYTHFKFAFGYDNSSETYKIVLSILDEAANRTNVRVLTVGDNVWRSIQSFPAVSLPFRYTNPGVNDGVYLNGSLNWLALRHSFLSDGAHGWKSINVRQFVIISLDLGTETYRQLVPPFGFDALSPVEPSICILMGCLCFSHDDRRTDFVIWKMEEFGVEDSWAQLLRISYQDLQSMHHDVVDLQYSQWLPLHLSDHANTLILANKQESQAILYNVRDNTAVRTRITDEIQWFSAKVHIESLFSDILELQALQP